MVVVDPLPADDVAPVWCEFADEADFKTWHDTKCAALGIPHPGQNQATGETDLAACWTDAYVAPVIEGAKGDRLLALIPADVAAADKLTVVSDPPEYGTIDTPSPVEPVAFAFAEPIPAIYEVDGETKDVPRTEDNKPTDDATIDTIELTP